jgi:hypothetical protein
LKEQEKQQQRPALQTVNNKVNESKHLEEEAVVFSSSHRKQQPLQ